MLRAANLSLAAASVTAITTGEWYPCPLVSTVSENHRHLALSKVNAECLDVVAPVCYPGVCESDKCLSLFVKRIPATSSSTPAKAVWLLQGGPGGTSQGMEGMMAEMYESANGTMSLYTMDHRGVGRSSRLQALCPKYSPDLDYNVDASLATLSDCFANITATYGAAAPKGFSTTSAASDLAAIIRSPILAASDVYVYGVSYGTYLVERLMHFPPPNVKGYILDSIVGESPVKEWLNWNIDVQPIESLYYSLCDKDPLCASKIGPDAKMFATRLYAKLDKMDTPCARALKMPDYDRPSDVLAFLISGFAQSNTKRNMIPAILFRMQKCVDHYDEAAQFLIKALVGGNDEKLLGAGNDALATTEDDDLLYHNIITNELYATVLPDPEAVAKKFARQTWRSSTLALIQQDIAEVCVYRGNKDPLCEQRVKRQKNSFFYAHDEYWNKTAAVPKGASVLMLSGALDTQTTTVYAVAEEANMAGGNKLLLQFPFGGHSIVDTTPTKNEGKMCGQVIFNSYLQVNGDLSKIDTRCVKRIVPLDFNTILDTYMARTLFGNTTDMFGDSTFVVVESEAGKVTNDENDIIVHAAAGALAGCVLAVIGIAIYVKVVKSAEGTVVDMRGSDNVMAMAENETTMDESKDDAAPTAKGSDAQCSDITVPLCHPGVCESTEKISVFVKRYPAKTPSKPAKAVWLLQGGPGLPSPAMESTMADMYLAANGTLDVYTMDHRGVGRSTPLSTICTGDQAPTTPEAIASTLSTCFEAIKAKYGAAAPKGFSTTSAATDLAAIIQSPLTAASEVYVYGVSYGTYLVERLMHFSPPNVKGYILDSIVGESPVKEWDDWDKDIASVETYYYSLCDKDPFCASKIGPNSKKFAHQLLAKLDKNDTECAQTLSSAVGGSASDFLGTTLGGMASNYHQRNMIPAVLYHMNNCLKDFASEENFLAGLLGIPTDEEDVDDDASVKRNDVLPGDITNENSMMDMVLYGNIVNSELWETPSPNAKTLLHDTQQITWRTAAATVQQRLVLYCVFRGNSDSVCADIPKQKTSFFYERDAYWNKTAGVPKGASVLMYSSAIDTQTIPKYADVENATMAGTNKLLLHFPYGGHSAVSTTNTDAEEPTRNCGQDILNAYVSGNGDISKLDTSCVAEVLPLEFQIVHDEDKAKALFGSTTDMYGDMERLVQTAVKSQSAATEAKHNVEIIALSCGMAACVLAVIGMAIYVKKVTAKASSESKKAADANSTEDAKTVEEPVKEDISVAEV
ncbi:serine protease family S33 [Achlya hypogyna]|uniref:Serine protease family S33 n=1 Tax=Achlya hypogyna TaxID=1202772 RepID=A0A1V9ZPK0_ACHHY|nr:serine protease family S33 [Achlya hypogyna]